MDEGILLAALDQVATRLTNIESKLDDLTNRSRNMELWVAEHGDTTPIKAQVYANKDDIIVLKQGAATVKDLKRTVNTLKASNNNNEGKRAVMFSVVKWGSAVLGGLVIWIVTKNGE